MKSRRQIVCRISARSNPVPLFVSGEQTVFGLVITPYLNWSNRFGGGFSITEPQTGLAICSGTTKEIALRRLRRIAIEKRNEYGSFRAAIAEQARNQRILQVVEERTV